MKTPKEYHYTYYSYEEWGRGYIGSRTCKCLPEEDVKYFGSFSDKTFNPKNKIILKSDYKTREEAYIDEIILQKSYGVVENLDFANKAYQTSTKFYYIVPREEAIRNGNKSKDLKLGIHGLTFEQRSNNGKKSGKIGGKVSGKNNKENKLGIFALTAEQRSENSKKAYKNGIANLTTEQRSENSKKAAATQKKNNTGIFSIPEETKRENSSKGGKNASKITNTQRWQCMETGFITNPGALTRYQKSKNIDTSKRIRIS